MVVLTGRRFLDELRKAPDDVLSFQEAMNDVGHRHLLPTYPSCSSTDFTYLGSSN
jgi:hypothetical protein